jgi:hypothetical protein
VGVIGEKSGGVRRVVRRLRVPEMSRSHQADASFR